MHGYLRARNWDVIFRRNDEKDKLSGEIEVKENRTRTL